ncbi:tail fiber/spike domain-containing protein [Enterobacter hormaechei]|uniref:tail fiber/spike domain-containing protein n=1 Tax=Enterobacter hormaechei TaxID=158836 RepID=UPI00294921E0|nr:hypothetical protein [Enterobacter hormaechei]MDV5637182.1 hypothetical protein [Enterobacter hormaechei]
MATQPTNLPVPSESYRDLKFNSGKIDEFVTSQNHTYTDRFGVQHWTISGIEYTASQAISQFGYITLDSFEEGNTLTLPNQVLRFEATGEYYRWDGTFPKTVLAGSTPETTGGIGIGAWISVGDASLRTDIENGYLNPKYSRVYQTVADMKSGNLKVGDNVTWNGYYAAGDGGGNTGVVKSGSVTEDGGRYFDVGGGLYVEAIFGSYVDPLLWGLSESRTAAQNKVSIDRTIAYSLSNRRPIVQLRGGTYNTDPIDIEGSSYDWFYWQCKKGDVTYICTNETTPLLTVRGVQISNTESNFMNTFQYCTIDGFRFSSPYCMLRFAYMEKYLFTNLIMSGRANAAGNFVCDAIIGPMYLREAAVWGEISNMIYANCNRAFRSGVGYQSELANKHVLVGDSTFKDWDIQNCGFVDGTYVVDCGYFDGGFFDNIQWHMNAAQPFVANVHCMRMYKPQLCRFKNCNFFEPNGIGLRLLSPRNCRVDSSNIIWGAGEIGTQPGLSIGNFDNITSINNKFSPMIVNCWGSAVVVQGQNDIDFTGLIEHDNCLAGNTIPGIALQGCTGIKLFDIQMDSLGGAAISVDAASCEVRNIDYRRYSSQTARTNGGTINCIPSNRVQQVSSQAFAGIFDDELQYNAASGLATVILPPASDCPAKLIRVIKTDSTSNGIQIIPASGSGNTINGAASYSLTSQYAFVQLRSTGNNWIIVGKS